MLGAGGLARWLAPTGLAVAATVVTSLALDRTVDHFDIGYRARRTAPHAALLVVRKEFTYRIVTNALGFRTPWLPTPKPPDTVRVVVGDSFTQGYGVTEEEAYPHRLEARWQATRPDRAWEVVNLGVPGTNPLDYLGNLRDPGLAYAPDVVVVGVMANDVHDVLIQPRTGTRFGWERLPEARLEVAHPRAAWRRLPTLLWPALYPLVRERVGAMVDQLGATAEAAPAAGDAVPGPAPTPGHDETWRDVLLAFADGYGRRRETEARLATLGEAEVARIRPVLTGALSLGTDAGEEAYWHLVGLVHPDWMRDSVLLPPAYDDAWRRVRRALAATIALARHAGARAVVTLIPDQHQVTAQARATIEARGFHWDPRTLSDTTLRDRVARAAVEDGALYVDLLDAFRATDAAPLYFPRDGHWTAAGHAFAARRLAEAIEAAGLP